MALRLAGAALLVCALVACGSDRDRGPTGGDGSVTVDSGGGDASGDVGTALDASGGGGREVGEPCTMDSECTVPADAECFTTVGGGMFPTIEFPGGFCSKGCDPMGEDGQCGPTAACASSSSSGGGGGVSFSFCSPPCSSDSECRQAEGYRCQIIFGSFGYCAPPG